MKPYPKAKDRKPPKVLRVKMVGPKAGRNLRKNASRIIDEVYLAFVRASLCACGCGQNGGNDPHHLVCVGQYQSKRNDYTAVPLCRTRHTAVGKMGLSAFERKYGVNLWRANYAALSSYELLTGIVVPEKQRICDVKLAEYTQCA